MPPVELKAPQEFTLTKEPHRTSLLRFLSALKRLTVVAGKSVKISFRNTRKMFPEGVLLFAAELDMILSSSPHPAPVRCDRPADGVVNQLFQHLGLSAKMRRKPDTVITAENVKYWLVKTDTQVDGKHTESLINEYKDLFSAAESAKLYEGLTEAMTNAKQHAHKEGAAEPRWWMFSQMRNDKLTVSFCDLGMGFRNSLLSEQKWPRAAVLGLIGKLGLGKADADYIKAAFELGKTRTQEPHRGKGLEELKEVIDTIGGHLRILSHKGYYFYEAPEGKEQCFDFDEPVPGTVISWQVHLGKGTKS